MGWCFRFATPGKDVVVDTATVEAVGDTGNSQQCWSEEQGDGPEQGQGQGQDLPAAVSTVRTYSEGEWRDTNVYE